MSILLYGCTKWTLTKRMEKNLDGNYTRMLQAKMKSCGQHSTKQQLYGHQQPILKTIKIRRTRRAGYCWRRKDELISDILLWTPSHGRAKAGRPARTCIQQLFVDTGYNLEELPGAMDDRDGWLESVRDICTGSAIWWWYSNTWNKLDSFNNVIHKMCLQIIYTKYMCINRIYHYMTYNSCYVIKPNQTTHCNITQRESCMFSYFRSNFVACI